MSAKLDKSDLNDMATGADVLLDELSERLDALEAEVYAKIDDGTLPSIGEKAAFTAGLSSAFRALQRVMDGILDEAEELLPQAPA